MAYKILAINPGSTSTKISLANDDQPVFVADIAHSREELSKFKRISDQYHFRKQVVIEELKKRNIPLDFDAVIGRGGLAKPVSSGVFTITKQMIIDQQRAIHQHACDLGCMIADEIAQDIPNCKSFIADPGVVDEMEPEARLSGSPLMPRMCIWHALNQKAIGRRFAKDMGTSYNKLNLIICHLGGGISIAAHSHGRAIDANNALDGEGPFSPERAGTLPAADLIHLCFSGKYTEEQLLNFSSLYEEELGEKNESLFLENLADSTLRLDSDNVHLRIKNEVSAILESRIIDGKEYLLLPISDNLECNGISIRRRLAEKEEQ